VLAGTAAFAHSPPEQEPQRECHAYRPNPIVPPWSPVEARPDANDDNYVGVCTGLGVVRVGTTDNGFFITADGSRGADVWFEHEPKELHYTKGYVLVKTDEQGDVHVYCAGGGQYEDGAQPDDELLTGDCGKTGVEPSPAPSETASPSPEPSPTDSGSPSPEPSPTDSGSPSPEPSPTDTPTP
jgi:hypothetical protein